MRSFSLLSIALTLASVAAASNFAVRSDDSTGDYLNAKECPPAATLTQDYYISPAPGTEIPFNGNVTVEFCTNKYFKDRSISYDVYLRQWNPSKPGTADSDLYKVSVGNTKSINAKLPVLASESKTKGYYIDGTHEQELVIIERWDPAEGAETLTFLHAPIKVVNSTGTDSGADASKKRDSFDIVVARDQ